MEDEALDPLITDATRTSDPEAALLDLTVVDPAVCSGHFVVAAARRLATALATIRTGDSEPGPAALRAATADVIERCIYGVDLNDLAAEITKVALWLEAFDGTRPFPFLDAHIKVGNSLLGATPALIQANIPDSAFTVLGDDDRAWTTKLKARNKTERARHAGQLAMFDNDSLSIDTTTITKRAREVEATPARTLAQVRARADPWRRIDTEPELTARKLAADTWCAAFVQPKSPAHGQGITADTLQLVVDQPDQLPAANRTAIENMARQYRFFHWHLEFPGIFTAADSDVAHSATGWQGGFSCVVGNPPWERVKIQDKEFFADVGRADIADAKTAAIRGRMIQALAPDDPPLLDAYISRCAHRKPQRTCSATPAAIRSPAKATSTPTASSPKPSARSLPPTGQLESSRPPA